jgi:hypothetical protein
MRETALKSVRLDRDGSGRHKPRSVGELISQQPLHTLLIYGVFCRHFPGDM